MFVSPTLGIMTLQILLPAIKNPTLQMFYRMRTYTQIHICMYTYMTDNWSCSQDPERRRAPLVQKFVCKKCHLAYETVPLEGLLGPMECKVVGICENCKVAHAIRLVIAHRVLTSNKINAMHACHRTAIRPAMTPSTHPDIYSTHPNMHDAAAHD